MTNEFNAVLAEWRPRLQPKCLAILTVLCEHAGELVTPEMVCEEVYSFPFRRRRDANLLHSHIHTLRAKLGSHAEIATHRGLGWQLIALGDANTVPVPVNRRRAAVCPRPTLEEQAAWMARAFAAVRA